MSQKIAAARDSQPRLGRENTVPKLDKVYSCGHIDEDILVAMLS
ncbi:MAG: hypothetical protein AAGA75_26160 [Cyanobacteria bacterium P01_E01_bin.6]